MSKVSILYSPLLGCSVCSVCPFFRVCNLSFFRVSKVLDFVGCRDKIVSGGHGVKGSNGRDAGRGSSIF